MSLLHLRNARLAELGEGCPCFWQVWHSLRKDGQVSTTWTMIFCQNIHTDLDYWLRLAVLMKIQWYSTRFFFYPPNWTKLDLTFILNNYQSFRSNRSLISGVLLTTGTIQDYKRSKTQKVKVATFTQKWKWPLSPRNTWRIYYEIFFNWILQFSSPLAPPPLLLPCPKCLLTEAWKASSFNPLVLLLIW